MQELSENFNAEVNYKQINVRISEIIKKSTTNMDTKYFYRAPLKNSYSYFDVEHKKVRHMSYARGTLRSTQRLFCLQVQSLKLK